MVLSGCH